MTESPASSSASMAAQIWIVDDDPSIRFVLDKALARHGLATRSFESAGQVTQALAACAAQDVPRVLLSDVRMPGGSGLQLLEALHVQYPSLRIIVMTAYSDLQSTVTAFERGAFEYLPKPFDLERVLALVERALHEADTEAAAPAAAAAPGAAAPEILGQAAAMQDVFRMIGRLSQSLVTVLVTGESGTGKELVARALHRHSPAAQGPFVAINTAAIPQDLLESELFGHERGAFTGAQGLRRGRFEQADGGTLFLDEIGDMPLHLQTRLLRVLSEGQFYRVGGHSLVRVQVRVIAATHQNLEARVAQGLFREDLFHRLNVIRVRLPALRERREDIAALAAYFLEHSARELGVEPKHLSAEALAVLEQFAFPGNVRQLENICHWLNVMAPAQSIAAHDLPPEVRQGARGEATSQGHSDDAVVDQPAGAHAPVPQLAAPQQPGGQPWQTGGQDWTQAMAAQARHLLHTQPGQVWTILSRAFEAGLIGTALEATGGRRAEAAQLLGIGRNTLTRKMQEHAQQAGPVSLSASPVPGAASPEIPR